MNKYKKEIIEHYKQSIEFVKSLNELSENEWRTPIGKGKWTIAEIIGHFRPWDEFVIQQRIPYLFSEEELPKGPEAKEINNRAAFKTREEVQMITIIKFISTRVVLCKAIEELSDENWERNFTIGKTSLSLYEYFKGLIEHDNHHFNQIKTTLNL
ncbi:DinB family protein [Alteribacter aurantiacus]|uniref:DinB family protein n=1 Tax=Alteribacter aurantiacus TaxID=254410 RepID=UPI00040B8148|nr:DinB family protein [Alteribacter aurantiacus]